MFNKHCPSSLQTNIFSLCNLNSFSHSLSDTSLCNLGFTGGFKFFFFFFTIVTCTHIICSKVNSPTHLFYFSLNVLKLYMRWNCLQQNETGLFYWKRRKDILIKTSHNFINSYIKKIDNLIFFFIILCLSSNIWFKENIARYTHREGMWFLELLSPL